MFGIGGLTGLPLGLNVADIPLHDTYYVIGHFHYVVAPGTIFALFAGVYYWYPKATGRKMNETLGKIHFAGSLVCMNVIFMPMFLMGLAGVSRRLFDGGAAYDFAQPVLQSERRLVVGRMDPGALPDSLHLQLLLEHPARARRPTRTRGRPRRSSGRRRRRRRTATSSNRRTSTADRTSTAFPARRRTSPAEHEA